MVAKAILSQFGYQSDLVVTGKEVLEAVRSRKYDLVFMDLQMPDMDGLEATRRIGTNVKAADRPYIIAMTANAMKEDRELCLSAGMRDFVSKPIRSGEIKAAIERAGVTLNSRS